MSEETSAVAVRLSTARVAVTTLITIVLVGGVVVGGYALGHHAVKTPATINVTGSGSATGTPDTAQFQVGVQTTAASAKVALAQNNTRLAAVIAALERHGAKKKDLQTSGLNIYPQTNNQGVVTGYTCSDDVNVTMHDVSAVGAALDAATVAAGNAVQLSGITFSFSSQSSLLRAARVAAMMNARTEASQIASGAHVSLGAVLHITDQENSSNVPTPIYSSATPTVAKGVANVPVQAGTQTVSVQVNVTYALG